MSEDHEITLFLHFWARRGVQLPNPMHYPKAFKYYVNLYRYYKEHEK